MSVRLAIDIGGTFTDATLIDEETGGVAIAKVLTTPSDPSEGFMQAVERALADGGVQAAQVSFVVHATTVATNAIIEGTIARSGFVTTDGFRDLLEIARQVRPTLYDTQFEKAAPLVPRDRAVVVRERLGPAGEVLLALDDDSVREAAAILRARRGRVGRRLPAALVRQPGARAARRRDPRRGAPRRADLALGRGRTRVPRVPARLDDGDQRGHPPGRAALPRAHRGPARRRRASRRSSSSCSRAAASSARRPRRRSRCSWSSRARPPA